MQISCVCLIFGGLGSSHLILRIIAFQTAAYFTCRLKTEGKLKEFSQGVTCTGKPHNGGKVVLFVPVLQAIHDYDGSLQVRART
jgi:hypothetical protein